MIENHRRELEEIARKRDDAQKRLNQTEMVKHKCDQDLAQVLDGLDQLRQRTANRIKADPDWQKAEAAADAAKKIALNADQKATLSEADLAVKGVPYEHDPLFMYLWNKHYGQAEDHSWNLVRYFDEMVARLIGYLDARANYTVLREIPLRLREHADTKRKDVEAAEECVTTLERKALVADGIEPIEAEVEAENTLVKAAQGAVMKVTAELQQIETERQQKLGSGDDAVYTRAVEMLSQALTQEDLGRLYEEALRTPSKEDDEIVATISKTRAALKAADTEVGQIRAQIREMARRRMELEGARDRARNVGFDNPMGNFGSGQDAIGQVIGGILRGALGGRDLDRVLRDNYRDPISRANPDFGGWRRSSFPGTGGRVNSRDRSGGSGLSTGGDF